MSDITSTLLRECVPQRLLARFPRLATLSLQALDQPFADLGLDSLDKIELLFAVEEHFDVAIPDQVVARMTSLADLVAYLEGRLAA